MSQRRTPSQRNSNAAMKMAVKKTKAELASKARTKTITTYPDGLWDKTLKKNLCKSMKEVNLGNGCKNSPAKAKRKKSTSSKAKTKPAVKKTTARKGSRKASPAPKKKSFLDRLLNR